jgi:hypothetical protein
LHSFFFFFAHRKKTINILRITCCLKVYTENFSFFEKKQCKSIILS